jgi:predicted amidohydrolase YtcJ
MKRTGVTTHGNFGNLLSNGASPAPAIASCVHCQLTNASLGDAIIGYTMNAAYAPFEEDVKGSTEVGKFADMIILSDNFFEMRADDIEKVEPLLTIVGGKEVCRSCRFPR